MATRADSSEIAQPFLTQSTAPVDSMKELIKANYNRNLCAHFFWIIPIIQAVMGLAYFSKFTNETLLRYFLMGLSVALFLLFAGVFSCRLCSIKKYVKLCQRNSHLPNDPNMLQNFIDALFYNYIDTSLITFVSLGLGITLLLVGLFGDHKGSTTIIAIVFLILDIPSLLIPILFTCSIWKKSNAIFTNQDLRRNRLESYGDQEPRLVSQNPEAVTNSVQMAQTGHTSNVQIAQTGQISDDQMVPTGQTSNDQIAQTGQTSNVQIAQTGQISDDQMVPTGQISDDQMVQTEQTSNDGSMDTEC